MTGVGRPGPLAARSRAGSGVQSPAARPSRAGWRLR